MAILYGVSRGLIIKIINNTIWHDENYIVPVTKPSKLDYKDIYDICVLNKSGVLCNKIGKLYNIHKSTVYKVIKGLYHVKR